MAQFFSIHHTHKLATCQKIQTSFWQSILFAKVQALLYKCHLSTIMRRDRCLPFGLCTRHNSLLAWCFNAGKEFNQIANQRKCVSRPRLAQSLWFMDRTMVRTKVVVVTLNRGFPVAHRGHWTNAFRVALKNLLQNRETYLYFGFSFFPSLLLISWTC